MLLPRIAPLGAGAQCRRKLGASRPDFHLPFSRFTDDNPA
jgi:hypothetical protein